MDSEIQNIELLNVAIKKLIVIEEAKGDENDQLLLSQVESLRQEQNNTSGIVEEPKAKSNDNGDINKEEIVKEQKKVKRQNSITHWLVSTMIVLIVAWQVSEVSLILKLKGVSDGLTHPFQSLGGLLTNVFKRRMDRCSSYVAGAAADQDSQASASGVAGYGCKRSERRSMTD